MLIILILECLFYLARSNVFDVSKRCHTCHILPPSEIDLGLFWLILQTWKGNVYFTELAERVEYGKYGCYFMFVWRQRTPGRREKVLVCWVMSK